MAHPPLKICQWGILSPSELFTKHGDKIIFKGSILSPPEIVTNYGDKIIFKSFFNSKYKGINRSC